MNSTKRNSNLHEWRRFVEAIIDDYDVVLIPDTDNPNRETYLLDGGELWDDIFENVSSLHRRRSILTFDWRFEAARMNMFVNNGPCVAATLSEKVKFLMFKMILPSIPHCTEDFLPMQGTLLVKIPVTSLMVKHTWLNDDFESLISSFKAFRDQLCLSSYQ